jgi:integrase
MATLRFRNDKWQVQVRRLGHQARTQSFLNKTDAQRWARHIETELDRTLIPNDVRTLAKVTLAELLIRYRDTVTINRRGLLPEKKRIEAFLRQDWCAYPLAKLNAHYFSAYRDDRLKCVGPGTVIRELGLLRSIFETARREWGYSSLENPLASIQKPKAPNGRERRLEPGELAGLSAACATVRSTLLLHGIHMAIETGMRRGELLAIQWKHVNFDKGVLHIPITKTVT